MAVHFVGKFGTPMVRLKTTPRFAALREIEGTVANTALRPSEQILAMQLTCQKGGPTRSGLDCFHCPRFAGWKPGPGADQVTVRCCWSDDDPVSARMTWASSLVTIAPDTPCTEADDLARRCAIRHLPVISDGQMVGILCACDLHPLPASDEYARARMTTDLLAIRPEATLGEAVAAMCLFQIGCLPVVTNGLLVGMLTRGDLRRAGVPEVLLGAKRCASCGSVHGVRSDSRGSGVLFCLECLDRSRPDADSMIELGEAD